VKLHVEGLTSPSSLALRTSAVAAEWFRRVVSAYGVCRLGEPREQLSVFAGVMKELGELRYGLDDGTGDIVADASITELYHLYDRPDDEYDEMALERMWLPGCYLHVQLLFPQEPVLLATFEDVIHDRMWRFGEVGDWVTATRLAATASWVPAVQLALSPVAMMFSCCFDMVPVRARCARLCFYLCLALRWFEWVGARVAFSGVRGRISTDASSAQAECELLTRPSGCLAMVGGACLHCRTRHVRCATCGV
jgi:hypothetical protein